MKLLVAPDASLLRTPDNKYWCKTIYSYDFFERYLKVFEEIVVVSRVLDVNFDECEGLLRSDGPNMRVIALPDMHGIKQYLLNLIPFYTMSKMAAENVDRALIRMPSFPTTMVLYHVKKKKVKYALEVVADPEGAYSDNKLIKVIFSTILRTECRNALGVSYVTKSFLQNKYPSHVAVYGEDGIHFESHYSTINLPANYYGVPRQYNEINRMHIIHIANSMNNSLKGHEVLLKTAQKIIQDGYDIDVTFIGDGALRPYLQRVTEELEIDKRVFFKGLLSDSNKVRDELLNADIMVFPTKTEGLPRTVLEAMAVGLPCISTPVGGIPELLENEDMLDPESVNSFVKRIEYLYDNPSILAKKSKRNIDVALNYSDETLQLRRNDFYRKLKKA